MAPTGTSPTTPSYLDLLRKAYDLGRADGVLAADVEPVADPGPPGSCCRGRDAEGFARHLWNGPPDGPPEGLIVNAPVWYGQGFREALAEAHRGGPADDPQGARPERRGSTPTRATPPGRVLAVPVRPDAVPRGTS